MTELLRLQAQGKTFAMSYVEYRDYKPQPERTFDEIVDDVVARAGLEIRDEPA